MRWLLPMVLSAFLFLGGIGFSVGAPPVTMGLSLFVSLMGGVILSVSIAKTFM